MAASPTAELKGYTTYRVNLRLGPQALSVSGILGVSKYDQPIYFPPAWQFRAPFGSGVGGVDPKLWAVPGKASARFDSWLTVGITDGDARGQLTASGFNFNTWNLRTPLQDNQLGAAISFRRPDDATPCHTPMMRGIHGAPCSSGPRATGKPDPGSRAVTIAQLTLDDTRGPQPVQFNVVGRRVGVIAGTGNLEGPSASWQQTCIKVWVGGATSGQGSAPYTPGMWGDDDRGH